MTQDWRKLGLALLFTLALHAFALLGALHGSARMDVTPEVKPQAQQMQSVVPIVAMLVRATDALHIASTTIPAEQKPQTTPAKLSPAPRKVTADKPLSPMRKPSATEQKLVSDAGASADAVNAPSSSTDAHASNPTHQAIANTQPAAAPAQPAQAAQPDYAYNPQPNYPMALREQGIGGVVWLRVWVQRDGSPGEILLAKGSGQRLLDTAALQAVRQWRFIPAKQGEQSLASWVEIPIRFALENG